MSSCNKDELEIAEASEFGTIEKAVLSIEKPPMLGSGNPNGRRKRCLPVSPGYGECFDLPKRSLHLYLYYVNSRYDEKEQYIIYDLSSLIADVGGYMGLLLGYSIQGMLEMGVGWWKAMIGRLTNGTKEGRMKPRGAITN